MALRSISVGPVAHRFAEVVHAGLKEEHGDQNKRHANQDEHDALRGPEQLRGERGPGVPLAALAKFVMAQRGREIGGIRFLGQRF